MKPALPIALSALLVAAPAAAAQERSSVWSVKSDSNTIYLAGGVPFLREADQPLPAQYRQAFDASQKVVFEVDPEEAKDEAGAERMIKMGMFLDGGSIEDVVSKETYRALGDFLSSSGAQRGGMDRFRPWFAAVMLSMTEVIKLGGRPDLGVADTIEGWAVEAGRPVSGLEKMKVELDLLKGLGKQAHEHMLRTTLEDIADAEAMEQELDEFLEAWRSGDVARLEEMDSEDETEMDRKINKKLIRGREARWMGRLEKILAGDEPTVFVIGLGHLVGEGNLRERLEAKGYEVEQLKGKKQKDGGDKKEKKPALIPVISR